MLFYIFIQSSSHLVYIVYKWPRPPTLLNWINKFLIYLQTNNNVSVDQMAIHPWLHENHSKIIYFIEYQTTYNQGYDSISFYFIVNNQMSNGFENNKISNACSKNSSTSCSLYYTCLSLAVALFDALSNAICLLATLFAQKLTSSLISLRLFLYISTSQTDIGHTCIPTYLCPTS